MNELDILLKEYTEAGDQSFKTFFTLLLKGLLIMAKEMNKMEERIRVLEAMLIPKAWTRGEYEAWKERQEE